MITAKPLITQTPTITTTTTTAAGRKSSRPPLPFQYPAAGSLGSAHDATVIRMIDGGESWADIEAIAGKKAFDRYYDMLDPELENLWTIGAITRLNQLVLDHRPSASPSASVDVPETVDDEVLWAKIADIIDSTTGVCKYVWHTFGDGRPISEEERRNMAAEEEEQERTRAAAEKKARLVEKRRKAEKAKSRIRQAALLEESLMGTVRAKQQAWAAARISEINGHQLTIAPESHISSPSTSTSSTSTPNAYTSSADLSSDLDHGHSILNADLITASSCIPASTTVEPTPTTVTPALTTAASASMTAALTEIEMDIETHPVISAVVPKTTIIQQEDEDSRQLRTRSRSQVQKLIDIRKLMEELARSKEENQRRREHDLAMLKEAQAALLQAEKRRKQTGAEVVAVRNSPLKGTGGNDIGANDPIRPAPDGRASLAVQELGDGAPPSLKRLRAESQDLGPASAQKTKYSTQIQPSPPSVPEVIDLTDDDPAPTLVPAEVAAVVAPSLPFSFFSAQYSTAVLAPAVSQPQAQAQSNWSANTNPYYDVMLWTKEDTHQLWDGWLSVGEDWNVISRSFLQERHSPQECQAFVLGKGFVSVMK